MLQSSSALALGQYLTSPLLLGLLDALIFANPVNWAQLATLLSIDHASGVQLDNIGGIINQPRPASFSDNDILSSNSFTWGSTDPAKVWGRGIWQGTVQRKALGDVDYRLLLKATIFAQNTRGTVPALQEFGYRVTGNYFYVRPSVGQVTVTAPYALNDIQTDIIKRTINVEDGISLQFQTGPPEGTGELFIWGKQGHGWGQGYFAKRV